MAVFSDPEGAVFAVWQPQEHKGARIVNEAGSLNFNGLGTRGVDAAKRPVEFSVSQERVWNMTFRRTR